MQQTFEEGKETNPIKADYDMEHTTAGKNQSYNYAGS